MEGNRELDGKFEPDPVTVGEILRHLNKQISYTEKRIGFHNRNFTPRISETLYTLKMELSSLEHLRWFIKTGYMKERKRSD